MKNATSFGKAPGRKCLQADEEYFIKGRSLGKLSGSFYYWEKNGLKRKLLGEQFSLRKANVSHIRSGPREAFS